MSKTPTAPPQIDWTALSPDAAAEIQRQGEKMLSDMLMTACAGDARASALASAFAAVSAGILGLIAVLLDKESITPGTLLALGVGELGFLLASLACIHAAKPIKFFFSGNEPQMLYDAAISASTEAWLAKSSIRSIQRRIDFNKIQMKKSGSWTQWGQRTAVIGLVLSVLAFCLTHMHH